MIETLSRLVHRHVLRHTVTFHAALKPDRQMRSKDGKVAIQVFEQANFQYPGAHWTCSCGTGWV